MNLARSAPAALALAMVCTASGAWGQSTVVPSSGKTATIEAVEQLIAVGADRHTKWIRLRVGGSSGAFAWAIPLASTSYVDNVSDALLDAADGATTPYVVAPAGPPSCGVPPPVETPLKGTTLPSSPVAEAALVGDAAALRSTLQQWGLGHETSEQALLAHFADGRAVLLLLFSSSGPATQTLTLRIVEPGGEPRVSENAVGGPAILRTYLVTDQGSARLGAAASRRVLPGDLVWGSGGDSNFRALYDSRLAEPPTGWLRLADGHGLLFESTTIPRSTGTIASVVDGYFGHAALTSGSSAGCIARARVLSTATTAVATPCPLGRMIARVGVEGAALATACGPSAGQTDPSTVACGPASDDLSYAFGGLVPGRTWLSRSELRLAGETHVADSVVTSTAEASFGPMYVAGTYEGACPGGSATPPPSSGPGTVGTSTPAPPEYQGDYDFAPRDGCACGATTTEESDTASDSCAGDTSDADDESVDSSDSCGGGSDSKDDGSSGSGCSGSSTKSDTDSDSDSSDSSSGGSSCSKSTSDSDDDDNKGCKVSTSKKKRSGGKSPLSRAVLALAAMALMARRFGRPAR